MIIPRKNRNWNKVSTKRELKGELDKIKGILNNRTADYLDALIELDYSVFCPKIISSDRRLYEHEKETLTQLELYRKIAIYNIYKRAVNIFRNKSNIRISGNNDGLEELHVYTEEDDRIELFRFDYADKDNIIGSIDLYQTISDDVIRKQKLESVMKTLEALYDAKNPYYDRPGVFGGPGSRWLYNHEKDIKKYEELFEKLDRNELTDNEKREIEITRKYHERLLKDYKLKEEDFEEERIYTETMDDTSKTLVKKFPGITIIDNIKYI